MDNGNIYCGNSYLDIIQNPAIYEKYLEKPSKDNIPASIYYKKYY